MNKTEHCEGNVQEKKQRCFFTASSCSDIHPISVKVAALQPLSSHFSCK
ncbi:MAG: hypothetical protein KBS99_08040 [Prevotellaceae bacterium]|nr:hypothetical protein [Candidatus Colivivens caballi]